MNELLDAVERDLGGSWRETVEHLRDQNQLDDVADRIHAGDIEGAVQGVEAAAKAFAADEHAAYVTAGKRAATWLDGELPDGIIRFDQANTRAVQWAQQNAGDLVREVTKEQRDLVRRVVADGVHDGDNPRVVARTLRESIGLTDAQAKYVQSYRDALEGGDYAGALDRELSDGRSDRSISAAMSNDGTLTQKQIDDAVDRYRSNWVDYRATTIARTEGLRVAHQGTTELFQQAIDNGDVEADALERTWNHASVGKNSRDSHEAMDGQTRGIDEPFVTGDGNELDYPAIRRLIRAIRSTAGASCQRA